MGYAWARSVSFGSDGVFKLIELNGVLSVLLVQLIFFMVSFGELCFQARGFFLQAGDLIVLVSLNLQGFIFKL